MGEPTVVFFVCGIVEESMNYESKKSRSHLKELTGRHKLFCRRYATHYNGTLAATEAGFKPTNAANTASLLLDDPKIINEVQRLERERNQTLDLDEIRRRELVSQIATTKITDVISWDSAGNIVLRPSDHIPERAKVGIVSVKRSKDGTVEVKFADKVPAVRLSAQMDGQLTERIEHRGNFAGNFIDLSGIPLDELAERAGPLSEEMAAKVETLRASEARRDKRSEENSEGDPD